VASLGHPWVAGELKPLLCATLRLSHSMHAMHASAAHMQRAPSVRACLIARRGNAALHIKAGVPRAQPQVPERHAAQGAQLRP